MATNPPKLPPVATTAEQFKPNPPKSTKPLGAIKPNGKVSLQPINGTLGKDAFPAK